MIFHGIGIFFLDSLSTKQHYETMLLFLDQSGMGDHYKKLHKFWKDIHILQDYNRTRYTAPVYFPASYNLLFFFMTSRLAGRAFVDRFVRF